MNPRLTRGTQACPEGVRPGPILTVMLWEGEFNSIRSSGFHEIRETQVLMGTLPILSVGDFPKQKENHCAY